MSVDQFLFKDLSGRNWTCKIPADQAISALSNSVTTDEELTELAQFVEDATEGDEFISTSFKLIAL